MWECYQLVKIPIIGMGGITDARDAIEFMLAGATAVQIGTQNFVDPFVWSKVLDGLNDYMTRHNVDEAQRSDRRLRSDAAQSRSRMNPILVALDVESAAKADRARRRAARIGRRIQDRQAAVHRGRPGDGPRADEQGDRVFLDLKFHDIPNTVAGAVQSAVATGAWMVNVHASGGSAMMKAAADAGAQDRRDARPAAPARDRRDGADQHGRRGAGRNRRGAADARSGRAPRDARPGGGPRRRRRLAAGSRGDPARMRAGFSDRDAGDTGLPISRGRTIRRER